MCFYFLKKRTCKIKLVFTLDNYCQLLELFYRAEIQKICFNPTLFVLQMQNWNVLLLIKDLRGSTLNFYIYNVNSINQSGSLMSGSGCWRILSVIELALDLPEALLDLFTHFDPTDHHLPAPMQLSYKWLDKFTVNITWSWTRPEDLPENCKIKYHIHKVDHKITVNMKKKTCCYLSLGEENLCFKAE